MEKGSLIIFLCGLALASGCPAEPIQLDAPPAEWAPVLAELGASQAITSDFKELRRNPFHKLPKRFEGRMWWHPDIGLCLYYEEPSRLIVNVFSTGVLMGRPDEPMNPLPGSGQQEVMLLFSKLFNWDTAWLAGNFAIEGTLQDSGHWQLNLRPTDESLAQMLTRIDLDGEAGLLQRILLDLRAGRTVEILLSGQNRPGQFSPEEIHHAFPSIDEK